MKYIWEDLPERKNLFTVKNTVMLNLNTGKTVQHYATNTKIAVVQKCITPEKTYYRTQDAAHHYLNYAFEAEAFGLPNEKAPSVHSSKSNSLSKSTSNSKRSANRTQTPNKKQTSSQKVILPNGGEGVRHRNWLSKIFRRKNGKTKNS